MSEELTSRPYLSLYNKKEPSSITSICSCLQVIWCSAAVDILFLLDGSHSIGKGSFERSKRFATAVCDALDISPGRVSVNTSHLVPCFE